MQHEDTLKYGNCFQISGHYFLRVNKKMSYELKKKKITFVNKDLSMLERVQELQVFQYLK